MKWPQPTRADHDTFCKREGWTRVRTARGNKGTDHVTYELALADGSVLRTKVSHPPDRSDYGDGLWQHILKDQLRVTEAEFWACVRDSTKPTRNAQPPGRAEGSIPAGVIHHLIHTVGLSEHEVAGMSRDEAITRLNEYWKSGR